MKANSQLTSTALVLAILQLGTSVVQGQNSDTPDELDLMVVYTTQALKDTGAEGRLNEEIDRLVADANRCFANSRVKARYRLVHRSAVNYVEAGDWLLDLTRLRTAGDGFLDEVHVARNLYKADIVSMLVSGQGALSRRYTGDPGDAFSVVGRHNSLTERWIFTHELAHNLGPADRVTPTSPYQPLANRLEASGVLYRTIVAYDPGIAVPYFSSTNVTYRGVPTGSATDNDVGQLMQNIPSIARFRVATNRFEFAAAGWLVPGRAGTAMVQVVRSGELSTTGRVSLCVFDGTAQANVDFTPATNHLVFHPGVSRLDCPVTILQSQGHRGNRTARLMLQQPASDTTFTSPHGNALGMQDAAELIIEDQTCFAFVTTNILAFEGDPAVVVTVRRGGDASQAASLSFKTIDGSAIDGIDYVATNGILSFAVDELEKAVEVMLLDDGIAGPDRNFYFNLEPRPGSGAAQPDSATVTIVNTQRTGSLDPQFSRHAAPNGLVSAIVVRPDGKVLCGGQFTTVNGLERSALVQFHADGTVDPDYQPTSLPVGPEPEAGEVYGGIWAMVAQPDGRVLVGGEFPSANGLRRPNLVRFNPDGSLDSRFQPATPNGRVVKIALQADGSILISGGFTKVGGIWRPLVARLHPDGSFDRTFTYTVTGFVMPFGLAVQPDQSVLLVYWDSSFMNTCVRLSPDGTRDFGFTSPMLPQWSGVRALAALPSGQVLIGGDFRMINGQPHYLLARLQPNGAVDRSFKPPLGPNGVVTGLIPLADGRIIVGGMLSLPDSTVRHNVLRLNADGSLDAELDLGQSPNDFVLAMAATANGWLYLAGAFTAINGMPAPHLARVRLDGTNPRLQVLVSAASELQLKLQGFPGLYALERSDNFADWTPVTTLTNCACEVECQEPLATGNNARFYRAVAR